MITLKTLDQATSQQVFDQVVNHLLIQNEKSGYEDGYCVYRLGDKKCAAGCLISEDEYKKSMEGHGWQYLVREGVAPETHSGLISKLQKIHDRSKPKKWADLLKKLAEAEGLTFNWRTNDNLENPIESNSTGSL